MDFEENDLHITNEDGRSPSEEENLSQQGSEVFADAQEHFSPEEQNIKLPEENLLGSSSSSKGKEEEKKKRADKVDASKTAKTLSQSLGAAVSLPAIAVSLVTAITVIGTTTGLISPLPSHDVSNFMSRSHELGFVMKGNANQAYLLSLFGGDYKVEEEVSGGQQYVFSDLQPNTVYNLDVFDMNVEPFRKVLSKSYLTKERDLYSAFVNNVAMAQSMLTFNVDYEGEDVGFVTVTVTDEAGNVLFLYEGAPQDSFTVDTKGNESVHITVSINGETVHYEPVYTIPQQWVFDETNHWHTDGDEIIDLAEHSFVEEILKEATFEEVGSAKRVCSICHYETSPYELPKKEHSYDMDHWAHDETNHWHACLDEGYGDLKKDLEAHTLIRETTKEATYEEAGEGRIVCSVCGYVDSAYSIPKLEHTYSSDWAHDETKHWHNCTDEGYEGLKSEEGEHDFKEIIDVQPTFEEDGSAHKACSVCDYATESYALPKLEHQFAEEWTTSEADHWHACLDEGYEDLTDGLGSHEFGDTTLEGSYFVKTCDVCGYVDRTLAESENAAAFTYTQRTGGQASDISGIDMAVVDDYDWDTVVLPTYHNGMPIKGILAKAFDGVSIQHLTIPKSYDKIECGALYGQKKLASIMLPFTGEQRDPDSSGEDFDPGIFAYIFGSEAYGDVDGPTYSVNTANNSFYVPESLLSITVSNDYDTRYDLPFGAMLGLKRVRNMRFECASGIGLSQYAFYGSTDQEIENVVFDTEILGMGANVFEKNPLTSFSISGQTKEAFEAILPSFAADWDKESMLTEVICSDATYSFFPDGCTVEDALIFEDKTDSTEPCYFIDGVDKRKASLVDWSDATLPSTHNDLPVYGINEWAFQEATFIKGLRIPSTYRFVEQGALKGLSQLERLTLPNVYGTESSNNSRCLAWYFGSFEFDNTYKVDTTGISGLTYGYEGYVPKSLTTVVVDAETADLTLSSYCLYGLSYVKAISVKGANITIYDHVFAGYGSDAAIESVTLNGHIGWMGAEAFSGNPLTTLTYAGTTAHFGSTKASFDDDWLSSSSLTEVKCSDGSIDPTTLFAPDANAFQYDYVSSLEAYVIVRTATDFNVLNSYNWNTVTLPTEYEGKPVVGIGAGNGFFNVQKIKHLIVPSTYTIMAEGALKGLNALESLTMPFVGKNKVSQEGEASVFGYIFGNTEYENSYVSPGYGSYPYSAYIPNSLSSVTIDAGTDDLVLQNHAMRGLDKVKDITIRAASITIPVGAFALETSEPDNATLLLDAPDINITGSAFGLRKSVTYNGTRQKWQAMETSSSWYSSWWAGAGGGFKVHCSDGDISY